MRTYVLVSPPKLLRSQVRNGFYMVVLVVIGWVLLWLCMATPE